MTEKVLFWLKPSKLLVSVMPFGGKNYVTNIVTGKAVQWASCTWYKGARILPGIDMELLMSRGDSFHPEPGAPDVK